MPDFIVSVRGLEEARRAFAGGADLLDLKEPANGPLGQPALPQVRETIQGMPREAKLSLACGELVAGPRLPRLGPLADRLSFAKVGCAEIDSLADWRRRFLDFRQQLPPGVEAVPAAYADFSRARGPSPGQLLTVANEVGAKGILVDTFCKRTGSLFEIMRDQALTEFVEHATQLGLWVALAGSLRPKDLGSNVLLRCRYVAMRGAVCAGGRESEICTDKVVRIAQRLRSYQPNECDVKVQNSTRATRA